MGFSPLFLRLHPEFFPKPVLELEDGATDVDLDALVGPTFYCELTENTVLTLENPADGGRYTFAIKQDAGGANTFSFDPGDADIYWESGTAPTITSTGDSLDLFSFVYFAALEAFVGAAIQDLQVP